MENGKLDPTFRDICYVLLRNMADNSFELVNAEDGSKVIRNVKHLRHIPVVMLTLMLLNLHWSTTLK